MSYKEQLLSEIDKLKMSKMNLHSKVYTHKYLFVYNI